MSGEGFEASYFTLCDAGHVPDTYNPDVCLPCVLGHVATLPGLLECTPCGAHAYSDVVGGAVCTDCPPLSQAAAMRNGATMQAVLYGGGFDVS